MQPRRLRRLRTFHYCGRSRYLLTFAARERRSLFTNATLARCVGTQILRACTETNYAVLAYCVMPDHAHVVVEGRNGATSLPTAVKRMKQFSAYYGKKVVRRPIWQSGYYDQILRDAEATMDAIAYVVRNPVRAGLVNDAAGYEFIGSSVYTVSELLEFAATRNRQW